MAVNDPTGIYYDKNNVLVSYSGWVSKTYDA